MEADRSRCFHLLQVGSTPTTHEVQRPLVAPFVQPADEDRQPLLGVELQQQGGLDLETAALSSTDIGPHQVSSRFAKVPDQQRCWKARWEKEASKLGAKTLRKEAVHAVPSEAAAEEGTLLLRSEPKVTKAVALATLEKSQDQSVSDFRLTFTATALLALLPVVYARLRGCSATLCLSVGSGTAVLLRLVAYVAVLALGGSLDYDAEVIQELYNTLDANDADPAKFDDALLLLEQAKWTRLRQVLFTWTSSCWHLAIMELALAATIHNWGSGALSGCPLTLSTCYAMAVALLPSWVLWAGVRDDWELVARAFFGTGFLALLMAVACIPAWRQGGDEGLAVHLIGVMAGLALVTVRVFGLAPRDIQKGLVAACFVGAVLVFSVIGACVMNLPQLLHEAIVPDLLGLATGIAHGNVTNFAFLAMGETWPTSDDLARLSSSDKAERTHFWLSSLALLGVGIVLAGTVVTISPPLRNTGKVFIPDFIFPLLTCATVMGHLVWCIKVLLTCALAKTLSVVFGVDFEGWSAFLLGGGLFVLLQASVQSILKPSVKWGITQFVVGVLSCVMPFLSDGYDTVKDAQFAALALRSETLLGKAIGILSFTYLIAYHMFALANSQLRLELQASFLPLLLAAPPQKSAGQAEESESACACCIWVWSKVLWALYSQTRNGKFKSVVAEDAPQTLLAIAFTLTDPTHVRGLVLALNVAIPIVRMAFAFSAHRFLAPLVIGQICEQLAKACSTEQWESAEEWLGELLYALDHSSDRVAALEAVRKAFKATPMTNRKFSRQFATDACAEVLGLLFAGASSLEELRLTYGQISDKGAKALAEGLTGHQSLRELSLFGNEISAEGAKALAESLKGHNSLREIDLYANQISDEGAKALAEALKGHQSLQALDLRRNRISHEGAKALAEGLKGHQSLRELRLGENRISDQGAKALAEGLKEHQSLRELDLWANQISNEGAKALSEAARHWPSLKRLDLESNKGITEEGKAALRSLMEARPSLHVQFF